MGIIIGDTIDLESGLTAQNTYGCIGNESVILNKIRTPIYSDTLDDENETIEEQSITGYTSTYQLSGRAVIWVNKEKRTTGSKHLIYEDIIIHYTDSTFLSSNLYTLLYTKWKENFTTVTDDI
tara:strand:+ start:271 stop:639 length:369 start_codon:yes stop_codon:yes gene_type:complete